MKKKVFSRLDIFAGDFARKGANKNYTLYKDEVCYLINPALYEACVKGAVKSVEFTESKEVITPKGIDMKIPVWRVNTIEESNMHLIGIAKTVKEAGLTQADIDLAKGLL